MEQPVPPLWGTFAVNDHSRQNAFSREVLLFNRLALPVPADDAERKRWEKPNKENEHETWDPKRLDALLAIIGSQHREGLNGARLAWEMPWTKEIWERAKSRTEVASMITTHDAFQTTRYYLASGIRLPGNPEAVAAFPSAKAYREETQPVEKPPGDVTAAQALLMLTRPLLVPDGDETADFRCLRDAVALASEADFIEARDAYHQWLRKFVARVTAGSSPKLEDVRLSGEELQFLKQELEHVVNTEREFVEKKTGWKRIEYAATVVDVIGTAASPLSHWLAAIAAVAKFVGWRAGKRAQTPEPRHLGGGAMFVMAERRLDWPSD